VGYDNYSYFSKTFKKNTGLSPIEFRQHHSVDI
ncbi:TPA: helix-turn-helix domain-containing protein, partial [Streptococcus suis]